MEDRASVILIKEHSRRHFMEIVKIPKMRKEEYDDLIRKGCLCRIAFRGDTYPYIAPFLYVFDGRYLYFLPTRYGRKIDYFRSNPSVSVEIDSYSPDLSHYLFVSLQGRLQEVTDPDAGKKIRKDFLEMIREKRLSRNVLAALGHHPGDPFEVISREDRTLVWKLGGVKDIVALKNG
jgi:nitroimidazol reductase NimA-like FMN-containing flavoprotein (pyridoxamine 5'-phosphate oxidase superfamily)